MVFGSLLAPPTALSGVEGNIKCCLYVLSCEQEELREREMGHFSLFLGNHEVIKGKGDAENRKTFSLVGSQGLWILYIEE